MIRTQVYITETEKQEIEHIAHISGKSQSDILREALDSYIERVKPNGWKEYLVAGQGLWKDRNDIIDIDTLRSEMDQRL